MRRLGANSRLVLGLPLFIAIFFCSGNGKAELLRGNINEPDMERAGLYVPADGVRVYDDLGVQAGEAGGAIVSEALENVPVMRSTNPVFETIGDNGKADDGKVWPEEGLGPCQGDCDNDSDCLDGLFCNQRDKNETVPGCSGVPVDGDDYCYDPNTLMPSSSPSSAPSAREPTISPVPTAWPSVEPTMMPTATPSMHPTRVDLIVLNDTLKPFNKCEGNCQNDDDCRGRLRCQKRGGYEFVPGCEGNGERGVNYCYDGRDGVAPVSLPSSGFLLRLYWERGYFWQEETREAKWCLKDSSPPQIRSCGSGSKFEIVYLIGPGDQIKVRDRDRCLERTRANAVSFQPCDESNPDQRFLANWASRRFDIRPVDKPTHCLSNHHHPKSGEVITSYECTLAHFTSTGYWNRY